MSNKKYNVTIIQATDPAQTSDSTSAALAKLFKISTDKAEKILQKKSFVIKKNTDKATAEKFHKAISAIGVSCQINEIAEAEEDISLPKIEDVQTSESGRPLTDITRPDIAPLHSEQADLSLVERSPGKSEKKEKIKPIDNVAPENYCPECGTIRASADSTCIHCGYDPIEIRTSNTKSILIKLAIILLVLAIAGAIAFPYYQQYAKQQQVQDDLKLAFDTRNKITDFILQTNFWPNQNIDAGLQKDISNRSLKSVVVGDNSVITVTIHADSLQGSEQTLIFTPRTLKGRIVWNCLGGTLQEEYRPNICHKQTP